MPKDTVSAAAADPVPISASLAPPPAASPLALPDKPSIAVLPFSTLSSNEEQGYFADGLTEDIITELSRYRSLFVIASGTAFTYKAKAIDPREVARELGVRYVVHGSCRFAADRVRVTLQLVDPAAGGPLLSERYDRVVEDVFALQEEITRKIVATVGSEIETIEAESFRRNPPKQPSAWQLAMRALFVVNEAYRVNEAGIYENALGLCERAIRLDPELALAWAALAQFHWVQAFYDNGPSRRDKCLASIRDARRAIDLDRREHRAFMSKGLAHLLLGEYDHALGDLRHAHELNPNDAIVLQCLGYVELMSGDPSKAGEHILASMRLNPKDNARYNACTLLSNVCFVTGDYAKGIEWGLLSRRERPDFAGTHLAMMRCYVGLGDIPNARAEAERLKRIALEMATETSNFRHPEHRERDIAFRRIALGLDAPSS